MTPTQLKRLRHNFGWTQDFAAFYIGVPYETFRSLETGRRTMPADFNKTIGSAMKAQAERKARKRYERFVRRRKRLLLQGG